MYIIKKTKLATKPVLFLEIVCESDSNNEIRLKSDQSSQEENDEKKEFKVRGEEE